MVPKISIITVVYNGCDNIEATIKSVINQSYPNLEYIIIDGGSKDGTVDIIKKYGKQITYWVSEADKGIYDAMNKGWAVADPESFVLYLGAGDEIMQLPEVIDYDGADIIYGDVWLSEEVLFRSKVNFKLKLGNTLHHQSLLVRKALHPSPPFLLRFKVYSDFDFNQRLYKRNVRFKYDKDFLSKALPGGISSSYHYKESFAVVSKNFGFFWGVIALIYYVGQSVKRNVSK